MIINITMSIAINVIKALLRKHITDFMTVATYNSRVVIICRVVGSHTKSVYI